MQASRVHLWMDSDNVMLFNRRRQQTLNLFVNLQISRAEVYFQRQNNYEFITSSNINIV